MTPLGSQPRGEQREIRIRLDRRCGHDAAIRDALDLELAFEPMQHDPHEPRRITRHVRTVAQRRIDRRHACTTGLVAAHAVAEEQATTFLGGEFRLGKGVARTARPRQLRIHEHGSRANGARSARHEFAPADGLAAHAKDARVLRPGLGPGCHTVKDRCGHLRLLQGRARSQREQGLVQALVAVREDLCSALLHERANAGIARIGERERPLKDEHRAPLDPAGQRGAARRILEHGAHGREPRHGVDEALIVLQFAQRRECSDRDAAHGILRQALEHGHALVHMLPAMQHACRMDRRIRAQAGIAIEGERFEKGHVAGAKHDERAGSGVAHGGIDLHATRQIRQRPLGRAMRIDSTRPVGVRRAICRVGCARCGTALRIAHWRGPAALHEQARRMIAKVPARPRDALHERRVIGLGEVHSCTQRATHRHHAPDATLVDRAIEATRLNLGAQEARHEDAVLDDAPADVGDVQRAVRADLEITGAEPLAGA